MPIQVSVLPMHSNTSACFSTSSFLSTSTWLSWASLRSEADAHEARFFAECRKFFFYCAADVALYASSDGFYVVVGGVDAYAEQ